LSQAHASREIALGVLIDELRRAQIESSMPGGTPSATEVETFYQSYPELLVRRLTSKAPTPWLGDRMRGYALSEIAPAELFTAKTGKRTLLRTPLGSYSVTPTGAPVQLGLLPLREVRPAIAAALRSFTRGAEYEKWTTIRQKDALDDTRCARDDLPQPGAVDLSTYLPFLSVAG